MGDVGDRMSVAPDAAPDEAAAVAAAIGAHLRAQAAAQEDSTTPAWTGRRWSFAGRLSALDRHPVRVPSEAPADPWATAARLDRL